MDGPSRSNAVHAAHAASQIPEPKTPKQLTEALIAYIKSASKDEQAFDEHIQLWQRDVAVYEYTPALMTLMHELSEEELHHPLFKLFIDDIPMGALSSFVRNIDESAIDDVHFNFLESALHERRTSDLTNLHSHTPDPSPPDSGIESS